MILTKRRLQKNIVCLQTSHPFTVSAFSWTPVDFTNTGEQAKSLCILRNQRLDSIQQARTQPRPSWKFKNDWAWGRAQTLTLSSCLWWIYTSCYVVHVDKEETSEIHDVDSMGAVRLRRFSIPCIRPRDRFASSLKLQ